ncbi:hypothetical protein IQ06DRAFT_99208 [Phaeosphaeriaceae sp. SRC1lsM3a]|nr:hypothetical protein IQ06DRAFT_99208 [Stagonospora sp. SRC1lsM3a]
MDGCRSIIISAFWPCSMEINWLWITVIVCQMTDAFNLMYGSGKMFSYSSSAFVIITCSTCHHSPTLNADQDRNFGSSSYNRSF